MNDSGNGADRTNQPEEVAIPSRLADDQFYRALASTDRRHLLYYLLDTTEDTVARITTVLGGWETTTAGTMHTPADRTELRTQLHHKHLPHLADAGLIDYDSRSDSVRLESLHPRVAAIIRQSVEAEDTERS